MGKNNNIENKTLKVLILEDSLPDMELMVEQLSEAGFQLVLTHAENEAQFIEAIEKNCFDLVLSDFRLPGFDAFGALEISQKFCPEVPFICISGSIGEETAIELLKQGAVDYVLKDRPERLPFAIKRALNEAKEKAALFKAERNLIESETRFRQVAENAQEWIWEIDTNGLFTYASPVIESLLGYTPDEVVGKKYFYDFFIPEKREMLKKAIFKTFSKKEIFSNLEITNIHKDGQLVYVSTSGSPVFDDTGNYTGYRGVDEDITERKRAEFALLQKTENLSRLLHGSVHLNATIDKKTVLQKIVDTAVELTGLETGAIYLVEKNTIHLSATQPLLTEDLPEEFRMATIDDHAHIKKTIQTKNIVILKDSLTEKITEQEAIIIKAQGFRTLIYLPLIHEEVVNGVLILGTTSGVHIFTDEELEICQTLSNMSSLALAHAWLFDENEQYIQKLKTAIEEKDAAANELRLSEEKFRNLFYNHAAVKLIIDPESGGIVEANKAAAAFYGWSEEILRNMHICQINTLQPEEVKKEVEKAITLKKFNFEFQHRKADGSLVDVEVFSSKIEVGGKEFLHSIVHDVSEKKKAEEQLKLLNRAVEASSVSVIITDADGNINYVNPFFTETTGYSFEDVKDKTPRFMKSGNQPKAFYEDLWNTILSGKDWTGKFRNRKKNGELYWENAVISPILNSKGEVANFVAIKEDITERIKMLEDLVAAKEKAEESDHLKSAFLTNMSHEIRTPMNGILGFTDLLLNPNLSNENRESYIKIVHQSGQRLLNTVNDIIEISKIETGIINVSEKETDINSSIEELIRFFKPEAEKKGLKLMVDKLLPATENNITTDRNKLDSILSNLIKNGIKYTESGAVNVGCRSKDSVVEFYIKDTGIGIPKDRQKAIFDRFMQADIADTRVFEGSGLGLAISKSYVEMLGGNIWVESQEGKGSTFYFTLSAKNSNDEK